MHTTIRAPVFPTENPEKDKKAVLNIFPDAEISVENGELIGESKSLERFREILRDQRIRDTARSFLNSCIDGNMIQFSISKQAAYMGKISFGGNNPALGEIEISIESDDPKGMVQWLTSKGD